MTGRGRGRPHYGRSGDRRYRFMTHGPAKPVDRWDGAESSLKMQRNGKEVTEAGSNVPLRHLPKVGGKRQGCGRRSALGEGTPAEGTPATGAGVKFSAS